MAKKIYPRREFIRTMTGAGAALLVSRSFACRGQDQTEAGQPNILFVMSDDHTSQALGCYDLRLSRFAPTPFIDGLRNEGALLKNCFCTNSICVPSRASILTGQYSHLNGVKTLNDSLGSETDTVARHLQQAGYETAVFGKWHLKDRPSGFNSFNILRGQGRYFDPVFYGQDAEWTGDGEVHPGFSTDVITDLALEWLGKRGNGGGSEKPFALFCQFKAVHEPFRSHPRYGELFRDEDIPEPEDLLWPESPKGKRFPGWPLDVLTERYLNNPQRYSPPPFDPGEGDRSREELRRATYQKFIKDYLRGVAGIDDGVGRLLHWLEANGLKENTIVIYTSDQGYFLGEHGFMDKRFMLEESLRMPFIIRYPREIEAGTTVDDIILNIDFAPLFLDYAGAGIPGSVQGRSFRSNLNFNTPEDWRESMYYHYWTHHPKRPSHYGIRTHRFKLIYYYGLVREGLAPERCWELYDLDNDPREFINQYDNPEYKDLIPDLERQLQILRQEFGDTVNF